MIKNYELDEIKKSMNIVARKTTIPQDGESFSDIEHAYEIALDIMSKEIPKEVEIKEWMPAYCPRCGETLSENEGDGYYKHRTFIEQKNQGAQSPSSTK